MTLPIQVMLDSGAFTAWTRGAEIDIQKYIAFIKRNEKNIWTYINLDVIPQKGGGNKTIEAAAEASYRNLQIMKDAGLNPLPVFHYGETFTYLERMLEDKEKYICLGGSVGLATKTKGVWFGRCFRILTDGNAKPLTKVHGLGVAAHPTIMKYPWASVDSATWDKASSIGLVPIPVLENGKPNWMRPPHNIKVSQSGEGHYEGYGPLVRKVIDDYISSIGVEKHELRYRHIFRERIWISYYVGLEKFLRDKKIVFCVSPSEQPRHEQLTLCGARHRLFSFFEITRCAEDYLDYYISSGGYERALRQYVTPTWRLGQAWGPTYTNYRSLALVARLNREEVIGSSSDNSGQDSPD